MKRLVSITIKGKTVSIDSLLSNADIYSEWNKKQRDIPPLYSQEQLYQQAKTFVLKDKKGRSVGSCVRFIQNRLVISLDESIEIVRRLNSEKVLDIIDLESFISDRK
jgi:hypothetical protein